VVRIARVVAAAALVLAAGCADDKPSYRRGPLTIATGGRGAVYFAYGQGVAEAVNDRLDGVEASVVSTPGSVDNLMMVGDGRAQLGFTLADSAALAFDGKAPFTTRQDVRALARLYDNYTHLVVRSNSAIRTVAELRGRAVSTGATGSGTELIASRLLELSGIDETDGIRRRRLSIEESATALRDGEIDAFFWSGGLPTGAVSALAANTPIRMIDLASFVEPLRDRYGDFYSERSVPASAYGLRVQVATVGVPNYLVVSATMDEGLAYHLTALLFSSRSTLVRAHEVAQQLDPRGAIATTPVPLHPGAMRYYRDVKP
jgi:TRAP transporter TAXI family solute receptor